MSAGVATQLLPSGKALPSSSAMGRPSAAPPASSAAGVLALLHERDPALQAAALHRLLQMIDLWWTEIADYLADIEELYEDESFAERQLAGYIASRVYFHLEEYGEAMKFALGSGKWFDITQKSLYVQRILAECVDTFIRNGLRDFAPQQLAAGRQVSVQLPEEDMEDGQDAASSAALNEAVEGVVKRLLEVCTQGEGPLYALGIAFDARRLDLVQAIFNSPRARALPPTDPNSHCQLMLYCLDHIQTLISSKFFRSQIISLLTAEFEKCLPLYDFPSAASTAGAEATSFGPGRAEVRGLVYSGLCRCLVERDESGRVAELLHRLLQPQEDPSREEEGVLMACQIAFDILQMESQPFQQALLDHPLLRAPEPPAPAAGDATEGGETATPNGTASDAAVQDEKEEKKEVETEAEKKRSIDTRSSLLHHGVVLSHMLMQAGTSCDVFLRCNLDWMARASNWARFSATASLGVVHKGHVRDSMKLLRTYLPASSSASSSPYSEGGAFYALGLISANQPSSSVRDYLLEQLQAAGTASEPRQQGCCLGLGLVCMGNADDSEVYEALKQVLFLDSAVAGEAAALGAGLLLLGSANAPAVAELLAYAQDTQHEKIRRACGIAIALLIKESDALIRYGGMFTIAMAYCATANSSAIRRLLHVSVSDVSDDVRRAAVIALGFVLCGDRQQLAQILKILSGSFNPHVRYGAALALGMASAGTGRKEVVDLLLPLSNDSTDFVRQGAFIGLGFVLQQVPDAACSEAGAVRQQFQRVIADKHEDVMARFGALLASGLIDAGGRNVVASMFSASGVLRQEAAVGFCLAFQLWYWYPLIHMVALSFAPSALIGLTVSSAHAIKKKPASASASSEKAGEKGEKDEKAKEEKEEKEKREEDEKAAESGEKNESLVSREETHEPYVAGLSKLRVPAGWTVACVGAKKGQFAYVPSLASLEKKEGKKQTIKAVLSTTAKRNRKLQEQKKKENQEEKKEPSQESTKGADAMDVDEEPAKKEDEVPKKGEEAKSKTEKEGDDEGKDGAGKEVELKNPCRVLPQQQPCIQLLANSRYQPIFPGRKAGFVLLRDTRSAQKPDTFELHLSSYIYIWMHAHADRCTYKRVCIYIYIYIYIYIFAEVHVRGGSVGLGRVCGCVAESIRAHFVDKKFDRFRVPLSPLALDVDRCACACSCEGRWNGV
ncbi:Proteasome/cyclosome repeat family protein,related [Neospora caninum Liverpool]|uniref:Proteasome/cyclosome repeat family protein,related n=1 Tax=Neospora caninum (strain Liverpool) TaxID=572307 RepID=F0VG53_NEOCL|nr:Proteasome/cyclosome repeat family protein,related [Neospora caninum Liverpool]CBZ52697.1 Proteasome/cyclosome repeat family protein,related [Neospora caninum Liverpool]|eukprot:XP_003882729.1 Proteasome/cyclosome repeat family protein,related [Neospora caninum Liverpool]